MIAIISFCRSIVLLWSGRSAGLSCKNGIIMICNNRHSIVVVLEEYSTRYKLYYTEQLSWTKYQVPAANYVSRSVGPTMYDTHIHLASFLATPQYSGYWKFLLSVTFVVHLNRNLLSVVERQRKRKWLYIVDEWPW